MPIRRRIKGVLCFFMFTDLPGMPGASCHASWGSGQRRTLRRFQQPDNCLLFFEQLCIEIHHFY
jgi:hypothetical protein